MRFQPTQRALPTLLLGVFADTTGGDNSANGSYALYENSSTNATAIGNGAIVNAGNKVRIGNSAVIEGQVTYSFLSDRRLKENIAYTPRPGLDFINRLQTVSYNYIADKTKARHDGFVAQDIEQVMKELDISFSGLKKSDDGMYSMAYSDFVMPLVNAVKELKRRNETLEEQVTGLVQI